MSTSQRKLVVRNKSLVKTPRIPSFMLASAIIAAILTALFYLLVVHLFCRSTYIEIIFSQRGPIPYITTYLTFIALTQLIGLFSHLRHESGNLELISGILGKAAEIDPENAGNIVGEIESQIKPLARRGLVVSRVCRVLRRVENKGSASDVAALLSEQAEIDRAILSNSYAAIRFIAWLIPVLGFIGTVLGISLAIAGFPELFQKGSESIGDQLGPITKNLGVAFETTLLALIKIAIVLFVMFAVQKRGNELLNAFDEFCLDNLLGKVRGAGITEEELPESYRQFLRVLSHHVETLERKFEQAVQQVVDRMVEHENQRWQSFTDTFREISAEHQDTVQKTCKVVTEKSEILASELRDFVPNFRTAIDEMFEQLQKSESKRVQEIALALTDAGEHASNALIRAGQDNAQTLKEVLGEFKQSMTNIEELLKTSDQLQAVQQTLNANLKALTQTGEMKNTLQRVNECTEELIPVLRDLQKRRKMQVRIVDEFDEESNQSAS
jgi:biopolymer transport protein ExbB/TolQ